MISSVLVWVLITGQSGGHVPPAQLGPFKEQADCERVAAMEILRVFRRQCIQVNMVFGVPK